MEPISFEDQVAVVTGAGGGLGKTYALELARRGARVVVNDLGGDPAGRGGAPSAAEQTVAEIRSLGGEAVANTDSVADPETGERIIRTALDTYGRLDIVINNAGILRDKSFANLDSADLEAVLDVHLRGAFAVSQPAFRHMKQQRYGRFLFTTSGSGLFGNFGQSNYAAAKMGLVGLSSVIAIEGAKFGITSNAIAPLALTRLTEGLLGDYAEALTPDQVTPLAVYLVSRACTSTHEVYTAGAGWFARVFVGVASGWHATAGLTATVEDVAEHIGEISSEERFFIPKDAADAMVSGLAALGLAQA